MLDKARRAVYQRYMSKPPTKRAAPRAPRGRAATAAPARPVTVTTFRLYVDQVLALQRRALERRGQGMATRLDASAVLRELLDAVLPAK